MSVRHTVSHVAHVYTRGANAVYICAQRWHHLAYLLNEVYVFRGVWLAVAIAWEQKQFSTSQLIHRDEWGDSRTRRRREERRGNTASARKLQEDVGNDECRTLSETKVSVTCGKWFLILPVR